MAPDAQLLTKQIVALDLDTGGKTTSVRFNLQRGKIARIWGFVWLLSGVPASQREYSVFVRKTSNGVRQVTPRDNLWASIISNIISTSGFTTVDERSIMFPKPHRTSGITVQMHCTASTTTSGLLIIYYDIDDVTKGELVQKWEKNISKGRTRRTIAP